MYNVELPQVLSRKAPREYHGFDSAVKLEKPAIWEDAMLMRAPDTDWEYDKASILMTIDDTWRKLW